MTKAIVARETPWSTVVLLCGKCARKMDGGYGPEKDETLRGALRAELKAAGRRGEVRLIETKCLGVCPHKATTVLSGERPDRLLVVPKGAGAREVLECLSKP